MRKKDISFELPESYGDNKITLMVRDPWTLFTYWEIRKNIREEISAKVQGLNPEWYKNILRVYEVTDKDPELKTRVIYDFELMDWANNWYIHTGETGREWIVEIGVLCSTGDFFSYARSNIVATPFYGMSSVSDVEWKCPEDLYYKMFAAAGDFTVSKSSLEMRESIERYLKSWFSSGSVTSGMFGSASFLMQGRKRS